MNETTLFGCKDEFAILLGSTKNSKKFLLQYWVKNQPIGNFKKSGELQRPLDVLQTVVINRSDMCYSPFNSMSSTEIWSFVTDVNVGMDEIRRRFGMLYERGILPILGPQFSNQQRRDIILFNADTLRFIWQNDFSLPVNEAIISFDSFFNVFEEFRQYCQTTALV